MLLDFADWLGLSSGERTLEAIKERCPNIEEKTTGSKVLEKILGQSSVVCSTLNSAGSNQLKRLLGNRVRTIYVDEAGQCTEAETYIAASFPGLRRLALIGDPAQLEATVLNRDCQEMSYGQSLMSHIQYLYEKKIHLLDEQYRCHPSIIQFSNEHFYKKKITTAKSVSLRQEPRVENPVLWIDTGEKAEEISRGTSRFNMMEVRQLDPTALIVLMGDFLV